MGKEIRLIACYKEQLKSLIWLSLQDDNSISIGMSDRTFSMPRLMSQLRLGTVTHENQIDLESKHGKDAITNPHFTFHPPMYVHFRANNQPELFAGLLGIDFIVKDEGRMPWIRFISNPFRELKSFTSSTKFEVIRLDVSSDMVSLEIAFDFVETAGFLPVSENFFDHFIIWGGRTFHVFANILPGQKSTLQWLHQS